MKQPALLSRATPALDAASAWMAGRSRREQILLVGLGVLLAAALLWLAILRPLLDARQAAIDRIAAYETVMVRVRSAGGAVGATAQPLTGPLETAIPTQAAAFGVIPTVAVTADGADVTINEARYDSIAPWLAGLEASGAVLSSVRIERGGQPGMVNVSLKVVQP